MLAVLALTSVTGCSLALSGPDPRRPRNRTPQCDTGKGPVTLDAVMGSILATGTLVAISEDEGGAGLVTGLIAAAYLGAAFRGNSTVNDCRAAIAAYEAPPSDPDRERPSFAAQEDEPRRRPTVTPDPVYTQPRPAPTGPPTALPPPPAPPSAPTSVAPPSTPRGDTPPTAPPGNPTGAKPRQSPPAKAEEPTDWRAFWTEVP